MHFFIDTCILGNFWMLFARQESIFHKYVFALLIIFIQPGRGNAIVQSLYSMFNYK